MLRFLFLTVGVLQHVVAQQYPYETVCPPLHVHKDVSVLPPTCTHSKMRAGVVCSFSCKPGYRVHGPPIKECTDQGTWTNHHMNISCTDINECKISNGGCSHKCINTVGGHRCECPSHLLLDKHGRRCKAEGLQLTCGTKDMTIVIPKNIIHNLHHEHLRLNDPSCVAGHNATHYILRTKLTECGTTSRQIKDYIVYSNKVSEEPDRSSNKIGRVLPGEVQVPFCCYFHNQEIVHAVGMRPLSRQIYIKVKGRGKLEVKLDFYKGTGYGHGRNAQGSVYTWDDFPVSVHLRQRLYFEVSLKTKENDLEIFADKCCSTPTRDHEASRYLRHTFIHNGCAVDKTVRFHSSPSHTAQRFSLEAFKFLGDHPFVFVHCHVMVCDANDPHSRCKKGCIPKPTVHVPHEHVQAKNQAKGHPHEHVQAKNQAKGHTKQKRAVSVENANSVTVSKGPFLLDEGPKKATKRERLSKKSPAMRKNMQPSFDESKRERKKTLKHGLTGATNIALVAMTLAAAMALVGVIYFGYKSRQLGPVGYEYVITKTDNL